MRFEQGIKNVVDPLPHSFRMPGFLSEGNKMDLIEAGSSGFRTQPDHRVAPD
jgi:hypothetical protein